MSALPEPELDAAARAQALAEQVGARMFAKDAAAKALGMRVERMAPGQATLTMRVRPDMLNGFAIGHGGLITTLADTAFAYACNSYNQLTVAQGLSVDFIAPAHLDDVLTATGSQRHLAGRTGVFDVTVTRQDGTLVALFRGKSYAMKGKTTVDLSE